MNFLEFPRIQFHETDTCRIKVIKKSYHAKGNISIGSSSNHLYTFEWYKASFDKLGKVEVAHVGASASSPKQHLWNAKLISYLHGEGHDRISNYAAHTRHLLSTVELLYKISKRNHAILACRIKKRSDILCCIEIRGWETVGYDLESEIVQVLKRIRAPGLQEALVIELGVYKGDVKASKMEELG